VILLALTLCTLAMVSVSALLRVAAEDLYAAATLARGSTDVPTRTAYGRWLSAQLSSDIASGGAGYEVLHARADELSYRSDRLRELAAVPAVIGLLSALLSDAPEPPGTLVPRGAKVAATAAAAEDRA
jgi:hypothetical protein